MNQNSNERLLTFWSQVMEKLDTNTDLYTPIPEVLGELCNFFEFGCGFLYEADHTDAFILRERYAVYPNRHTQVRIHLREVLGEPLLTELSNRQTVVSQASQWKSPLEEKLGELFQANSMVLIPVTNQDRALIALVGVVDRRGQNRLEDIDIAYSVSILRAIASHVKLHLYQDRMETTQQSLINIMDNMGVELYVSDFYTNEILYMNQIMAQRFGGVENALGKICHELQFGYERQCDFCPRQKLVNAEGQPTDVFSWDYFRAADKTWHRVLNSAFNWVDGRLAHVCSSIDITASKRNESLVRRMADTDPLTGLPNRRKLVRDLDEKIAGLRENSRDGYLLFFDLDGLKAINDRLGHRAGDELIAQIAAFLNSAQLTRQRSYRYGDDEFVILCSGRVPSRIFQIIAMLDDRFSRPWALADGEISCRASVGIAHFPLDCALPEELLHQADMAMYEAKRAGGGVRFYNKGAFCTPEEYLNQADAADLLRSVVKKQ